MRFETEIHIARPVEDVFAFISDFRNLPLWNYYILNTAPEESGPPRMGLRYRQQRKTDTQRFEICDFEPCKVAAIRLMAPTPQATIRFIFEAAGQGTKLGDEWSLKTPFPIPGFVSSLIVRPIRAAVDQNLQKLKILLETGSVELQDGRRVQL